MTTDLGRAREMISTASAFVFAAGAGMGVDSGLPDFRGDEGFWKAYPPFAKLGLGFQALANPRWFEEDPHLAWGFYGHRLALYRRTVPHAGFAILKKWSEKTPSFVFTSNVDGQFQRAGFDDDTVFECHGSIHHVQCTRNCGWFVDAAPQDEPLDSTRSNRRHTSTLQITVAVDEETMRAKDPLPRCGDCGATARPALLMFGDGMWDDRRSAEQEQRFQEFVAEETSGPLGARGLVVVECGAGTAVPSVRHMSESLVRAGARLLRINVREPEVPRGQIGLAIGAAAALKDLDQ
jgi:NAD-dependent SIR2 family protein deacetylase